MARRRTGSRRGWPGSENASDTPGGLFGVAIHLAVLGSWPRRTAVRSSLVRRGRLLAGGDNDDFSFRELGIYRLRDIERFVFSR